jgi:hypothetical protein
VFYLIFRHLTIYTVTYTVDGYDERITQPAYSANECHSDRAGIVAIIITHAMDPITTSTVTLSISGTTTDSGLLIGVISTALNTVHEVEPTSHIPQSIASSSTAGFEQRDVQGLTGNIEDQRERELLDELNDIFPDYGEDFDFDDIVDDLGLPLDQIIKAMSETKQCPDCPKSYKLLLVLEQHRITQHKKEGAFKCTEQGCDKSFAAKSWLERHLVSKHKKAGAFKCTEQGCPESFAAESRLKRHLVSKHKKEGASMKRKVDSGLPTTFPPSAKRAKPAPSAATGSE